MGDTRRIYKYLVDGTSVPISMPRGAQILHVAVQEGRPYLWALVDLAVPEAKRLLRVVGTGHPLPSADSTEPLGVYVGTVLMLEGTLVLHVFDLGERG